MAAGIGKESMRTKNDDTGPASLPRQTVIVTGGNSGLGYGCASALLCASPPWHVMIACRDPGRAQKAVEMLRESARPGTKVETMALDLASLRSVRSFASKLEARLKAADLPPLHGLVCNAAVQGARTFTADGFESTFGVSHLGHYLLVNLLVPLMEKPARIAVVASGVHDPAELAKVPASMAVPVPAWNTPTALAKGDLWTRSGERSRSIGSWPKIFDHKARECLFHLRLGTSSTRRHYRKRVRSRIDAGDRACS